MAQLNVRINDDLKAHLQTLARQEGRSTSDVVRSLVRGYVRDRDRSAALQDLWNRMEERARSSGAGPDDVSTAIDSVRSSKSEDAL